MAIEESGILAWGVDVGGTDCKVGVVDETGSVRAESGFETPDEPEVAVREIERAWGLACPGRSTSSAG